MNARCPFGPHILVVGRLPSSDSLRSRNSEVRDLPDREDLPPAQDRGVPPLPDWGTGQPQRSVVCRLPIWA